MDACVIDIVVHAQGRGDCWLGRRIALAQENSWRSSYQEVNFSITVPADQSYFSMEFKKTTTVPKQSSDFYLTARSLISFTRAKETVRCSFWSISLKGHKTMGDRGNTESWVPVILPSLLSLVTPTHGSWLPSNGTSSRKTSSGWLGLEPPPSGLHSSTHAFIWVSHWMELTSQPAFWPSVISHQLSFPSSLLPLPLEVPAWNSATRPVPFSSFLHICSHYSLSPKCLSLLHSLMLTWQPFSILPWLWGSFFLPQDFCICCAFNQKCSS